jgi:signal transduction histidine kinase
MLLDASHLTEYLTNLPLLQVPGSLLQTALNEGLRMAHGEAGLIAFFDYEEGRETGSQVDILRRFLALQAAQAQANLKRNGRNGTGPVDVNPLSLWLPKGPALMSTTAPDNSLRRVMVLPLFNPSNGAGAGVMLYLLPRQERAGSTSGLTFNAAELSTLTAFSRATANAWFSLRSLTNVSRRLEDLVLLNEIATAITSNRNLPTLLQEIMNTTSQLLHAEACTLMLLDRKTDELVFTVPSGEAGAALKEYRQPAGRGISGYVARIGEPVIVNDVSKDPRFNKNVDNNTGFKTRSVMCAPLIVREKIIGVIEVLNKLDSSSFNPNDMALLLMLAAQAAIAIENAQLYSDLKEERDRLIAKEEEVRRDLARDLHDGPAQVVAGIVMKIDFIKKALEKEPSLVGPKLDEVEKIAQQVTKDIRTMMFGLRPLMLETQGLVKTLEAYVEKLQSDSWESHLIVEGFGDDEENPVRLPLNVESTVFIIIQEAINNIRKHAQPNNVWIELQRGSQETIVMVRDDGKGFDSRAITEGYEERTSFGLLNMRERARLINATYDLQSQPGKGTTVMLTIPNEDPHRFGTAPLSVSLPSFSNT